MDTVYGVWGDTVQFYRYIVKVGLVMANMLKILFWVWLYDSFLILVKL